MYSQKCLLYHLCIYVVAWDVNRFFAEIRWDWWGDSYELDPAFEHKLTDEGLKTTPRSTTILAPKPTPKPAPAPAKTAPKATPKAGKGK